MYKYFSHEKIIWKMFHVKHLGDLLNIEWSGNYCSWRKVRIVFFLLYRIVVTIQNQDNTSLYCAELHSPYENVVAAGQKPSP